MLRALPVAAALAALIAAAPARPVTPAIGTTVRSGGLAVTLLGATGRVDGDALRDATALRVEIVRDGIVARPAAPLRNCRYGCDAGGTTGYASATIADLDGDGEPEVLVDRGDGATPCCTSETAILHRSTATGAYHEVDARLGASYALRPGGRVVPGGRRLLGDDVRFAEAFAPRVAGLFLPGRVLAFRDGRLEDVTPHSYGLLAPGFRALTRDLRDAERRVDRHRRGGRLLLRAVLPAWVAEARALGRGGVATRRLATEVHRGRISPALRSRIRDFVRAQGY